MWCWNLLLDVAGNWSWSLLLCFPPSLCPTGLKSEGLYRVSGFTEHIEDVKMAFDRGKHVPSWMPSNLPSAASVGLRLHLWWEQAFRATESFKNLRNDALKISQFCLWETCFLRWCRQVATWRSQLIYCANGQLVHMVPVHPSASPSQDPTDDCSQSSKAGSRVLVSPHCKGGEVSGVQLWLWLIVSSVYYLLVITSSVISQPVHRSPFSGLIQQSRTSPRICVSNEKSKSPWCPSFLDGVSLGNMYTSLGWFGPVSLVRFSPVPPPY